MWGPFGCLAFFTYPPTYLLQPKRVFSCVSCLVYLLLAISISWGKEKIDIGGLGDVWVGILFSIFEQLTIFEFLLFIFFSS